MYLRLQQPYCHHEELETRQGSKDAKIKKIGAWDPEGLSVGFRLIN